MTTITWVDTAHGRTLHAINPDRPHAGAACGIGDGPWASWRTPDPELAKPRCRTCVRVTTLWRLAGKLGQTAATIDWRRLPAGTVDHAIHAGDTTAACGINPGAANAWHLRPGGVIPCGRCLLALVGRAGSARLADAINARTNRQEAKP